MSCLDYFRVVRLLTHTHTYTHIHTHTHTYTHTHTHTFISYTHTHSSFTHGADGGKIPSARTQCVPKPKASAANAPRTTACICGDAMAADILARLKGLSGLSKAAVPEK